MRWQGAEETQRAKERERMGWWDSHRMPSLCSDSSSQQDSEQDAITDALGQHMLTSTLDFDSCYVNLIHDKTVTMTGSCWLPGWDEEIWIHLHFLLEPHSFNKKTMRSMCDA